MSANSNRPADAAAPEGAKGRTAAGLRTDPAIDVGEATAGEPADAAYETQPADLSPSTPLSSAAPKAVIAAGIALAVVLAGVGWYAARPRPSSLELTPGAPTEATPTASRLETPLRTIKTSAPSGDADTDSTGAPERRAPTPSAVTPPDKITPESRARAARPAAPRVRPAPDASALDTGANTSATAPMERTPVSPPLSTPDPTYAPGQPTRLPNTPGTPPPTP
jgi:hypothetical protein